MIQLTPEAKYALYCMKEQSIHCKQDDYIAVTRTGKVNTTSNLERRFKILLKNAGVGDINGGPVSYTHLKDAGEALEDYLQNKVFGGDEGEKMDPDPEDVKGFDEFIKRYRAGFPIERAAVDALK